MYIEPCGLISALMDYTVSFCYLELSRYVILAHNRVRDRMRPGSDLETTATLRFFEEVRMAKEGSLLSRNIETKYQSRMAALRDGAKRPKIVLKLDRIN